MSVPTVVAATSAPNGGTSLINTAPPSAIANGDLLFVEVQVGNSTLDILDWESKGWWRYVDTTFNSRENWLLARIYNASDAASVYTFTLSAGSAAAWLSVAVRSHGVTKQSDIILGSIFTRATSVGTIVMPTLNTPSADYRVLGFTGEATSTAGDYAVTDAAGFSLVYRHPNATVIEDMTVWTKEMPAAGATGSPTITYTAAALNGIGYQVAVPPAAGTVLPSTGQIGAHLSLNPDTTTLSIGVDKLGGTVVKALLMNAAGTVELARATVTNDATSGWGNARFTGLPAGTEFTVLFDVDGVIQTDASLSLNTQPDTAVSFKMVAGSCQFTASDHLIWDRIREQNPLFLAHMGDIHYDDAATAALWRAGMEKSLNASKFKRLLETVPLNWVPDNHDRIITNPTGTGTGLNLGETDPQTNSEWRKMAGTAGWPTELTLGRTWTAGRVRFIQTDGWSVRDDGDGDPAPRTFLGAAQKQWFKDTLAAASEPLIVWFTQWTTRNNGNGRWNSFPEETAELEAFINARPALKRRMVLIGGDSHSLQADSGSAANTARMASSGYRFKGMPSLNMSGFHRSSDAGDGAAAGEWDIGNLPLRVPGQLENDWGGYSRMTFTDEGSAGVRLFWEAVRVNSAGVEDVMKSFNRVFGGEAVRAVFYNATTQVETPLSVVNYDGTTAKELRVDSNGRVV